MNTEAMSPLIGQVILYGLLIAAVAAVLIKNWSRIKEICMDDDGKWDVLGGLNRVLSKESTMDEPHEASESISPDRNFLECLQRQKGAWMRDYDLENDVIREHIIFRGRVQGVGFRYQAMLAARTYGLTGWAENLSDGTVEMEVQGTPLSMGKMIRHIKSSSWIRIEEMEMEMLPVVPGEKGFGVRGY